MLHMPPEALTEHLKDLAEKLPLLYRPPQTLSLDDIGETASDRRSMDEEIGGQIALMPTMGGVFSNASRWCELLDARGYLNCTDEEAARGFGIKSEIFVERLRAVQDWIEPAGFFAHNLADCLTIQLRRLGLADSDAAFLLRHGREDLEHDRMDGFLRQQGWSRERLANALKTLRRLDPTPGYAFERTSFILPELEFTATDESVTCKVALDNLPHLALMEDIADFCDKRTCREARNIIQHLAERNDTLARIGNFLAAGQKDFLMGHAPSPAPLGLKEIAVAANLHVSTISRILSTRWARSDRRGLFRLSALLMRKLMNRAGESRMDYAYLEHAIRSAVDEGLKDAELARFLGIPRRTVAYHRLRLGIIRKRNDVKPE